MSISASQYDAGTAGSHTETVGLERSWICARLSERFCQGEVVASAGPAEYTVTFCLSSRGEVGSAPAGRWFQLPAFRFASIRPSSSFSLGFLPRHSVDDCLLVCLDSVKQKRYRLDSER